MHDHQHHDHLFADWIPVVAVALLFLIYLAAALRLKKHDRKWNVLHTLCFAIGCALVTVALVPEMMRWGHASIRGHMVQHLLIAMFGPIFLVLGAPVTLMLKSLPSKAARVLTRFLRSTFFSFVSHPIFALVLNIGGMFALYLTPLYSISLTNPTVHYLIHIHFLAAGYLFTWSMIGLDPAPRRPRFATRVFVLFLSIALHAFLTKFMYAYLFPKNTDESSNEIREAAKLMYYGGDLSELLLLVILFAMHYSKLTEGIASTRRYGAVGDAT